MEMTAAEIDFDIFNVLDRVLHFEDTCSLQADAWKKSKKSITGVIENFFKQCLEAHPDDPDGAVFGNPGSDCQIFQLQIYKTTSITDGLSVAFTIKCEDEKYYMCCTEDMKLYFKKGDCPDVIAGNRSEIIFFQKEFSEGNSYFKFQSSLQADYYLAVSDEGGKQKLILQKSEGLNERQKFNIEW
ncbi:interleukin-18-like [Bufo bufo]|uniref:interleukin-18-like n=1 Tax=Bufo bufo TaxID=8384 RepID=UPI001ABE852E|nr:interleukin-18-like [Bufo bufo]